MPFRALDPSARLPVNTSEPVVCIPLYGAHDYFVRSLTSVLRHTSPAVPILIADDCGPDPASEAWTRDLDAQGAVEHQLFWMRQPENLGFVENVNTAFASSSDLDIALLNSDCEVADGWLDGLREAAYSQSQVATATALTNSGTILSVPHRNVPQPLPQDLDFDESARRVRLGSLRLRPRIPTAIGHCMYIRRSALDLVGVFDQAFRPAYGEEVDFSQRCLRHGLDHVVADDVLVLHHGSASLALDGAINPAQADHERTIRSRYPYYATAIRDAESDALGPLARSLRTARRSLVGTSVTIDGRCLTRFITGTQVHALELIHALWQHGGVHVRVLTPPDLGTYAGDLLVRMPGVELLSSEAAVAGARQTDIVHRPYQVSSNADLVLLARLGERLVITHQDLIAYRNPAYHRSPGDWTRHRRLTRQALSVADLVLFFSRHAKADAELEDLVRPDRARVVPIGVDHAIAFHRPAPQTPALEADLLDRPFLFCLGTDFHHKNRLFALRLLEALSTEHAWPGRLVLAGPTVSHGSSRGAETEWLAARPQLTTRVVRLAAIDEAEKAWLYEHCAAVLYPTTYEGFGLIPFEAADYGVPCLFAAVSSLVEVLPSTAARLVPWDPVKSAAVVHPVLTDPVEARQAVTTVRLAGARFTWSKTAQLLLEAYRDASESAARDASQMVGDLTALNDDLVAAQDARSEWEGRYWHLRNVIGGAGMALVGPGGRLPGSARNALAALTAARMTRAPVVTALETVHRVGSLRRRKDAQ